VGGEVNFGDFIGIELVRSIHPSLYETIYQTPDYFLERGMMLNEQKARELRGRFYKSLKTDVPADKSYVFGIVAELFPAFEEYEAGLTQQRPDHIEAERERRIFHPRFFRQYFLFRVPPELYSLKQFDTFVSSVKRADEEQAKEKFNAAFKAIVNEDSKRWHFMHLIDMRLAEFPIEAACGLCRGIAQNAVLWPREAFEFDIGIRATYQTLLRIEDRSNRKALLRSIIDDSGSDLYSLYVVWVIEKDKQADQSVIADVAALEPYLQEHVARKYLSDSAPSVYDLFKGIDPHQFLFAWSRLGDVGAANARAYIHKLLIGNVEALKHLLKLLFRVEFIDDYAALKPLFDYDLISKLIDQQQETLDPEKVHQFRERHSLEKAKSIE
jgi:hypothetical protein